MTDAQDTALEEPRRETRWAAGPTTPHLFSMTWRDGLYLHWPVSPDRLRPHVPAPLELETRNGEAWVSVLPFVLARAGLRGSPGLSRLSFPELNVRTYVRHEGTPGLFFFSIDVGNAFIARGVRRATRLPVHHAKMNVSGDDDRVAFSSIRVDDGARFSATYEPDGKIFYADPGTLEHWLTARRRFYAPRDGDVLTGEIAHAPWPLQSATATIHENTMLESNGLPGGEEEPLALFSGELSMTGSIVRRLRQER
ncbi:YqjF family protein [Natronobeatus ordinarius]|uniref:YqjF family protein n=1 Tax=Natronobeatus ordinarius TaxID=2963433 RepID=UPI0020CC558C|nr:DUF2071 domain-containing protein [Natronobeatus ordinarius]